MATLEDYQLFQDWMDAKKEQEDKPVSTEAGLAKGGAGAVQGMAQGQDKAVALGSGLTTAGMVSANPILTGAGLALSTAGAIKQGQNQRAQQRYQDELKKIQARQDAINRMAQIGQNLKA